jgi:hypothetical protein
MTNDLVCDAKTVRRRDAAGLGARAQARHGNCTCSSSRDSNRDDKAVCSPSRVTMIGQSDVRGSVISNDRIDTGRKFRICHRPRGIASTTLAAAHGRNTHTHATRNHATWHPKKRRKEKKHQHHRDGPLGTFLVETVSPM